MPAPEENETVAAFIKGHGARKKASIPFSFIWMASDSLFFPAIGASKGPRKPDQKRAFLVPPSIRKKGCPQAALFSGSIINVGVRKYSFLTPFLHKKVDIDGIHSYN